MYSINCVFDLNRILEHISKMRFFNSGRIVRTNFKNDNDTDFALYHLFFNFSTIVWTNSNKFIALAWYLLCAFAMKRKGAAERHDINATTASHRFRSVDCRMCGDTLHALRVALDPRRRLIMSLLCADRIASPSRLHIFFALSLLCGSSRVPQKHDLRTLLSPSYESCVTALPFKPTCAFPPFPCASVRPLLFRLVQGMSDAWGLVVALALYLLCAFAMQRNGAAARDDMNATTAPHRFGSVGCRTSDDTLHALRVDLDPVLGGREDSFRDRGAESFS